MNIDFQIIETLYLVVVYPKNKLKYNLVFITFKKITDRLTLCRVKNYSSIRNLTMQK